MKIVGRLLSRLDDSWLPYGFLTTSPRSRRSGRGLATDRSEGTQFLQISMETQHEACRDGIATQLPSSHPTLSNNMPVSLDSLGGDVFLEVVPRLSHLPQGLRWVYTKHCSIRSFSIPPDVQVGALFSTYDASASLIVFVLFTGAAAPLGL